MKILVIGDQHFKDNLSYADYVADRRIPEKKEILDFILEQAENCQHIVLIGDNFNSKNNSSETNREYVEFLERFGDKEIYVISGNHEKKGDGKTAIDFLGEVKKKNWHIFNRPGTISFIEKHKTVGKSIPSIPSQSTWKFDFLPYMLNSELGVENHDEASKEIMKHLDGGDILFAHHLITDTTYRGMKAELFHEVILPREKLEKKYKLVVAGHVHEPQQRGNTLITGSLFTSEVGEIEKFIWKINADLTVDKIKVPAREIHKLENPTAKQLSSIPKNAIVKAIITDKKINVEELKEKLNKFDASLVIEDYPNQRKKAHIEEGAFDFSLEALLKLYAKEKNVDIQKLMKGLQIING